MLRATVANIEEMEGSHSPIIRSLWNRWTRSMAVLCFPPILLQASLKHAQIET